MCRLTSPTALRFRLTGSKIANVMDSGLCAIEHFAAIDRAPPVFAAAPAVCVAEQISCKDFSMLRPFA
jgi:hypothetical protein